LRFLGLQFGFGRGRFGQHLEEEIEARLPVGAEQFERKRGAVVAGVGMERAAELLDVAGELLGVARRVPLTRRLAARRPGPALPFGFGQQAAGEGGAERKQRQRVLRHVERARVGGVRPSEMNCGTGRRALRGEAAADGFSALGTSETRFSRSVWNSGARR
jgi:hypothetical protein